MLIFHKPSLDLHYTTLKPPLNPREQFDHVIAAHNVKLLLKPTTSSIRFQSLRPFLEQLFNVGGRGRRAFDVGTLQQSSVHLFSGDKVGGAVGVVGREVTG